MESWVTLQKNPSQRFLSESVWSDRSLSCRDTEEAIIRSGIKEFLEKVVSAGYCGHILPAQAMVLRGLLQKYVNIKQYSSRYAAMNLQSNQLQNILGTLKDKEAYVRHMKEQQKVFCKLSKSKHLKQKEIDSVENNLRSQIDKVDPGNVVGNFDILLRPVTTELDEENKMLYDGLYDDREGVVKNQVKSILSECMPGYPDVETKDTIIKHCMDAFFVQSQF